MQFYQLINCDITLQKQTFILDAMACGGWTDDAYRIQQRLRGECTQRATNGPTFCQFIFMIPAHRTIPNKTVNVR